jgi:hypothetical protein
LKSLHLKISEDTHTKFCKLAGDRKLNSVQVELFTEAVEAAYRAKFHQPDEPIKTMGTPDNE